VNEIWQEKLADGGILIIDGATGSELRRRGVTLSPHAWSGPASGTHAHMLRDIHLDYVRAGADVITTNTFGTTRFLLDAAGLDGQFEQINERALNAALDARKIAASHVAIAGSMSCLPPSFDTAAYPDLETELAAYIELADYLANNGADLIVLEMMQETVHAPLACEAARQTGLPVWLGLSCRLDQRRRCVGYDFPAIPMSETLDALLGFDPDAIAIMHSPPVAVEPALSELRQRWPGVVGAYPEIAGDAAFPMERWTALARSWIEMGARIVGGCCGTSPAHIRALRDMLAAAAPA
jgi:S-methylmethionine-dependent homocysteine/selenocysteine methylase